MPYHRLFLVLLALCASLASLAPAADLTNRFAKWEKEIAAFEAADRATPPPTNAILFIGSSSIRLWKTLAQDFPDRTVINRGFGGSEIEDAFHFSDRIVLPYRPRMIVMYAGGNDLNAGKSPARVFTNFVQFVTNVQAHLPGTSIAFISSAPNPARWAQVEKVKTLNCLVAEYCQAHPGLTFINVFPKMLDETGQPKPNLFVADRLHMNTNGYAIWREVVGPYLPKP